MRQLFLSQAGVYFYYMFMQELTVLCLVFSSRLQEKEWLKGTLFQRAVGQEAANGGTAAELVWKIMAW